MLPTSGADELRIDGRMTWRAVESGWITAPEELVAAIARDGFEKCKREMTTSQR